jgi:hypothetical protein
MAMPKFHDPMAGQISILKTATCESLSGQSTLTYQLGYSEDKEVYVRLLENTGGGQFSNEWISLKAVQDVLEDNPEPLTSFMLQGLFVGKSANTPAFLMAALVHEKWLRVLKGKKRGQEILDTSRFMAKMAKLVARKGKTTKKTPASRKKKATV